MKRDQLDVSRIASALARDIEEVDSTLKEKDRVREEVISLSREITRISGNIVSQIHRDNYESARELLRKLSELVEKLLKLIDPHPDLKYSGLVYNCLSEYVEARTFYSIVVENELPSLRDLGVPVVPYLQGLGDVIGELRRLVIKLLNRVEVDTAERYLEIMEAIYDKLRFLDYPDALLPGLRHKVDVASRLIEDTRVLILHTKNSIRCIGGRSSPREQHYEKFQSHA